MKKLFTIILAIIALVIAGQVSVAEASTQITGMFIDDKQLQFTDALPYIDENDRTMVPVRVASEAFGAKNYWDAIKKQVTLTHKTNTVVLTIGSKNYTINSKATTMDTAAVIKNGRTMVPFRFIGEAFGMQVDYKHLQDGSMAIFAFTKGQDEKQRQDLIEKAAVTLLKPTALPTLNVEDKNGYLKKEVSDQYRKVVYNSIKKTDKGVETFLPEPPVGYEWSISGTVIYTVEYAKEFRRIDPLYPNGSRTGVQKYGNVVWEYGPRYKDSEVESIIVTYGLEKISNSSLPDWDAVDVIKGEMKENTKRKPGAGL